MCWQSWVKIKLVDYEKKLSETNAKDIDARDKYSQLTSWLKAHGMARWFNLSIEVTLLFLNQMIQCCLQFKKALVGF